MVLTILTDADIQELLLSLNRNDILELQQSLADALHYYSSSVEEDDNGCCSSYQPMRTSLKRRDGQTTLFMPASTNDALGVKIVTLQAPADKGTSSETSSLISRLSFSSGEDSTGSSSTNLNVPESISSSQSTTPRGSLTLLDQTGTPRALINAEELTAFRTALASTMLIKKRANVHDICVFGAGKQAYWHIRLSLLLRGPEIHHVNLMNRSFERAASLMQRLISDMPDMRRTKFSILTPGHQEYSRLLKEQVRQASVIFCTTPSTSPLFPASHLTNPEGRKKGRYICLIGSYKPHMVEIHPDVLRQAVAPEHHHHHHRHAKSGGAIIVDSVDACLKEAGEVIQAGLKSHEVVEIGELVMLKRDAEARRRQAASANSSVSSLDESGVEIQDNQDTQIAGHGPKDPQERSLKEWLERGNVIYKSVGLGLMDVTVGTDLVRLADERGLGTRIQNF